MSRYRPFAGRKRRFRDAEDGSATIEALLWIPFLLAFLMLILDASTIFMWNSQARRIVADANRQYVKGATFDNTMSNFVGNPVNNMANWIEDEMAHFAPNAVANVMIDPVSGLLTTIVTYPSTDTDLSGATGFLGGLTLRVQSIHQTEF